MRGSRQVGTAAQPELLAREVRMAAEHPYPRLRAIEVHPAEHAGRPILVVQDPCGLAVGPIAVSGPALFIFSLLDGEHSPQQIRDLFEAQFKARLPAEQLDRLLDQLDVALYLENDRFAAHVAAQRETYRTAPARVSDHEQAFGAGDDGLAATLDRLLEENERVKPQRATGRLAGLIAPHLDFARGQNCYADVYGLLGELPPAQRFVILGTNHRGLGPSVVATDKDFQTPLGTTRTDRAFLAALADRCGADLCEYELDHLHEHSVELQVLMLQHVLGADAFEIVPLLCPDPCAPCGTAPPDGRGVDLRVLARVLRDLLTDDPVPTVIIAAADLSHVGRPFGDDRDLNEAWLDEVAHSDQAALQAILDGNHDEFVRLLANDQNSTHICSAGSIFTLAAALPDTRRELLRYHQAVNWEHGLCVSCCSALFWEP